jgi:ABC-type transport system substrate-binding protein
MKHKKVMIVLAFVLIASLVLSACQPQTIIQTVEVEKVVEKMVEKEVQVEVEKLVEKTSIVEVERKAFTDLHPILGDLRVRQAMAHCTNKVDLARAGYPLLEEEEAKGLVMDTFIPKAHWAYAGDENVTIYEFDPEKGAALLEEAGWSLGGGSVRSKEDGSVLALKFATTTAAFRQAWAAVWERQMAQCGVQILRSHVPASWWFGDTTGLAVRDFEIGAFAWVGQADPGGQTLWACDQIPLPENNWEGQNYMGWCNEAASQGIKNANNTLIKEERINWYKVVQQEYAKDVPAIPIFNRTETFSTVANMVGFDPKPGEEYYTYNVQDWEIPGKDTIVVGFTQEPASLYALVESAYVAVLASGVMGFRSYTSLNYDFQPYLVTQLSTLESGLAQNNDIEAKEGDTVLDAAGDVVELKPGVQVIDASGATVDYTGGSVTMKQLVVKYDFRPDITWQDGSKLSQADLELGYQTVCDRESGATSFITCDKTQDIQFEGTAYTVTWLPGVQDPLYFLAPYGFYPSNQPIESAGAHQGKTLKDVPAKDWPTLTEVAERPWSYGPYKMVQWDKGEKIVYEANEYFFLGAPKTKNLIIAFVSSENAESQLLTGQVDMLGSETLAGLTDQLVNAEKSGQVNNIVLAGATWEHIDFNLYVK